ncbi:ketosamine-3-kinase isoform X2 [Suricata suricatta]|uniref:ketosamine-3-kinase isoform X2 n=1 Tax=Suricata suricatta TaxID=37032 RepID=UPI001155496F|nr:ketosamine-3-kinase isoform X2 [Suricata suricatta]
MAPGAVSGRHTWTVAENLLCGIDPLRLRPPLPSHTHFGPLGFALSSGETQRTQRRPFQIPALCPSQMARAGLAAESPPLPPGQGRLVFPLRRCLCSASSVPRLAVVEWKGGGQADRAFVDRFGFAEVTCCGYLPQVNDWQEDWVTFYARQRIQPQMDMVEKGSGDREALELWSALQLKIPDLFRGLDIVPALLHGDLWAGNAAEDSSGPIIFDPASFYGHSEYELAIVGMFGGFTSSFYSAYHSAIPKAPGFEARLQLYQLFHYLNHWNHFGSGYRGSSLSIMRNLIK